MTQKDCFVWVESNHGKYRLRRTTLPWLPFLRDALDIDALDTDVAGIVLAWKRRACFLLAFHLFLVSLLEEISLLLLVGLRPNHRTLRQI